MTAPSATELPTAQPNVPANSRHPGPRAVPSVSSVLILPPGPIVDRHRRPQERLQAARRPPAYPNQARIIAPVTPSHPSAVLTPSTCMNRWIRANQAASPRPRSLPLNNGSPGSLRRLAAAPRREGFRRRKRPAARPLTCTMNEPQCLLGHRESLRKKYYCDSFLSALAKLASCPFAPCSKSPVC